MAEFADTVRARHMVRAFTAEPVGEDLLTGILSLAVRAPSAGNTRPWSFLVLRGPDVDRYWEASMPDERARAAFRWQGLLHAPVLVIPYVRPSAYVDRYSEPDKSHTALGLGLAAWSVPYWWIDGGAVVQNLLLAATDAGLGASLFGQFEHEAPIREAFDVPDDQRALGTIALGWPASDTPGRSRSRARRPLADIVHVGHW